MANSERDSRRIRLTGERFSGGRLPVDSLVELERYQHLVRVLARAEWTADHPGEAVPAGFDEDISLTIERVEEGSADIFMVFEQHAVYAEYQVQADNTLNVAIAAAYSGKELSGVPDPVRAEVREGIVEFGSTLEPEQSIDVYVHGPDSAPVSVTIVTRKEVIDHLALDNYLIEEVVAPASGLKTIPESVVGRITEVDADKATFRFDSLQHGRIIGRYDTNRELITDIRRALDSQGEAQIFKVRGDLQYRGGKPWRFKTTESVELFATGSEPWAARLIDFTTILPGWGESGDGSQIEFVALDAASKILAAITEASLTLPGTFPTESGGVVLEWASREMVRSIEIGSDAEFEMFDMPAGSGGSLRVSHDIRDAIAFATGEKA